MDSIRGMHAVFDLVSFLFVSQQSEANSLSVAMCQSSFLKDRFSCPRVPGQSLQNPSDGIGQGGLAVRFQDEEHIKTS